MPALSRPRTLAATLTVATLTVVATTLSVGARPGSRPNFTPALYLPADNTPLTFTDVAGKAYGAAELGKNKATVFVFSSTECPLAAKYTPRILALAKEYGPKGIGFFLVNSNASDNKADFVKWAKERGYSFPMIKDEGTTLADRLNVSATPEVAVVDAAGTTLYLGRVDDNPDPAKIIRRDLAEALNDILASKPVRTARTRANGCAIFRDKAASTKVTSRYTWAKDIAPVLEANCITCHRTGDVGPFALDSYEQAKLWAGAIKDYTARRIMPPWKAIPGHGEFHDSRWLTDQQLNTLAEWADGGTPKGNLKDLPPAPVRPAAGEWTLGKPDVVLKANAPFRLEAEGADVYRDFTLPMDFTEDRYVTAFDFKPGNRAIVHHMIAYIDVTGSTSAKKEGMDGQPGWNVSGGSSGIKDDDWGDGWAPGMNPRRLEPGIAVRIPKGAKLVLQVHYHKSGRAEADQSELALYFAPEQPKKVLRTFPVGNVAFVLPPNVANKEVRGSIILPFESTIWQLLPHMHLLGKEMKATAVLPDGTEKSLIWIKNWDFNWQMNYRLKEPLHLPKGTRINLVATYDNTAANPFQPSNPPREVRFGEQTDDEMCFMFIGFTKD